MIPERHIRIIGPRSPRNQSGTRVVNTTSKSGWSKGLSPFLLGPVELADGRRSQNMENGWQYAKVYAQHADANGNPTPAYWKWSQMGMNKKFADRFPMGKGARPLYSLLGDQHLDYIEARKHIYFPLYRDAVRKTQTWEELKKIAQTHNEVTLWDFDGYDRGSDSLKTVLNNPNKIMGHAFVLAAMLAYGEDVEPQELP